MCLKNQEKIETDPWKTQIRKLKGKLVWTLKKF